jgi:hypothetical protein
MVYSNAFFWRTKWLSDTSALDRIFRPNLWRRSDRHPQIHRGLPWKAWGDHLFPRFRKAGKLVDLVNTLYTQHQAGPRVTERMLATARSLKTQEDRDRLQQT